MNKNLNNNKRGSALALTIIFAAILLQLALVYSNQVRNTSISTHKIDERIRLQYLSDGLAQIALLKFQQFPSDFYYAWEYKDTNNLPYITYTTDAPEFKAAAFKNSADQPDSVLSSNEKIEVNLTGMVLQTTIAQKWQEEILTISTEAKQKTMKGKDLETTTVLTVLTTRTMIK